MGERGGGQGLEHAGSDSQIQAAMAACTKTHHLLDLLLNKFCRQVQHASNLSVCSVQAWSAISKHLNHCIASAGHFLISSLQMLEPGHTLDLAETIQQ